MLYPIPLGQYTIEPLALAPMAGVTDRPFRQLCRQQGAGYVVSEMVTSDPLLWKTSKSSFRLNHAGEESPKSVQIVGYDPDMLAEAAQLNVERGAEVIDINMGCPAKKVCNRLAGSALLQDEALVARILSKVVKAVSVPVTLKTRTGWDRQHKNGVTIAQIAEDSGIQLLAIHGRTRADKYEGDAEYDTIRAIKQAVKIPVLANGDIDSPEKALTVLQHTGCDGIMLGRAAHGRPWIFREIRHYLNTRTFLTPPSLQERADIIYQHVCAVHEFYGEDLGVRFARKHIAWYGEYLDNSRPFVRQFHKLTTRLEQRNAVKDFFAALS
ncbi:tRNA dihydrouridine synthase DusB [Agitococcus lubricus]|uniref:tRNA-dihydrouridine synthase B n=1 Tax=Agitococcus lubricus TaxID=1077255 RepID=A0A2T5J2P5_9GAMM|nr:tRNA dihydrouridine synthase DusB [Agitococcus lubricus]PTQ90784.1 tRNA-U20-dihydrouridine synthase [Agitococcus lubricus]